MAAKQNCCAQMKIELTKYNEEDGKWESTITRHHAGRCHAGELAKKQASRPSECEMKDVNTLLGCHKDIAIQCAFSSLRYIPLSQNARKALCQGDWQAFYEWGRWGEMNWKVRENRTSFTLWQTLWIPGCEQVKWSCTVSRTLQRHQ